MIHLSSYHSNGLPPVVWSNKVNLIGEKVYKPKIHFCESCNKPILIYGRLIPCKHVFCFTCASLCLPSLGDCGGPSSNGDPKSPPTHNHHNHQSSTSNHTGSCHRCGGRTLRVERNSLNSIFVCQIDSCKRTYLSARDLQAHVTHRHSKSKSASNNQASNSSASQAAISSSPYISSSTLLHLNGHNHHQHPSGGSNRHRQSSTSSNNNAGPYSPASNHAKHADSGSPAGSSSRGADGRHRRDRESHHHHHNHHPPPGPHRSGGGGRNRDRHRNRGGPGGGGAGDDDIKRERDNKEYLKQSVQRAAQWAEASAQTLEKGLTSR